MPRSRKAGSSRGFIGPLRGTNLFRQAEPFELGGAADHQPAQFGVFAGAYRAKIDDSAALVGDVAERSVEARPTLGVDLLLQPSADLPLAARPQFQCDPLRCAAAKTVADVVAADDQVVTVVGAAADEHMDVRIVGVPVIDRHPIKLGAEVALRVGHQFPSEGAKIGHLARILWRHGEPEMMPVLLAPFDESLCVGVVGSRVEHTCIRAVAGDALAFEVGDVL